MHTYRGDTVYFIAAEQFLPPSSILCTEYHANSVFHLMANVSDTFASTYPHTYLVMEAHKKRVPFFFGRHNVTQCYFINHGNGGGLRVTKK